MTRDKRIAGMLRRIFDEFQPDGPSMTRHTRREEFVFHMTDWTTDLRRLTKLYASPSDDSSSAGTTVASFLYHAIPHLNAAGRLLLDSVPDAFRETRRTKSAGRPRSRGTEMRLAEPQRGYRKGR